ncbi:MAG TPA: gluconate 2-dehydrogenase subunit 3 family protein [Saprospiraceae bacterium]|nr:gluconate 2-dehydrogenase subunit 3 family protein [Saprospiraceae bacterium]HMQ83143.1 gluconate 2-dehydrogenase subunit 3 family protein [Saprospiraceae bacterium]
MNRRELLKNTAILGGASVLSTSLFSILQSCQSEPRLGWTPTFLSPEHALLVSALVDTLLPKTNTPGGLDMKVDLFMDAVFSKLYDDKAQEAVVVEMDAFNQQCRSKYGKPFYELDATQKGAFLKEAEANSPKFNRGVWGTAVGEQKPVGFYRSMKSLAVWAYCTSQEVGSEILAYDPVPGDYLGCVPLSEVGTVWSL